MSKSNRENVMRPGATIRSSGRAPHRTKRPTARSTPRGRSHRKNGTAHKKRSTYLPAMIIGPLRAIAERITDRRGRAILLVLIDSELRPSELVGLSRGQIRVRFEKQKDKRLEASGAGCLTRTATEQGRKFTIGPEAVEALRDYLRVAGGQCVPPTHR
jgi:integrase